MLNIISIIIIIVGTILISAYIYIAYKLDKEWDNIKIGDIGFYTDGGWISENFTVISKTKATIVIEYNVSKQKKTIYCNDYLSGTKTFNWKK